MARHRCVVHDAACDVMCQHQPTNLLHDTRRSLTADRDASSVEVRLDLGEVSGRPNTRALAAESG